MTSGPLLPVPQKGSGCTVLVIANFAKEPCNAKFTFDAAALGFDGAKAAWELPAIEGVQKAAPAPDFNAEVEVPAGGGFILVKRR